MSVSARSAERRLRRRAVRRRRILAVAVLALAAGSALLLLGRLPQLHRAVQEVAMPLRHEDIIRQQAEAKDVDPALIAAVIYAESRFVEGRTSTAGALGLMQVTPETAEDIARRSGGTAFTTEDLGSPQINISYGTYHLRFLLSHYGGQLLPAVAAYNAGQSNVDRWIERLSAEDLQLTVARIPFAETRNYTRKVLDARREYERKYAGQLGISDR